VPNEVAAEVAAACTEFVAAEAVVLDYLKAGRVDVKGYTAARKECRDRIEAIERKLKGGLRR
jgi:hypothetical protein